MAEYSVAKFVKKILHTYNVHPNCRPPL